MTSGLLKMHGKDRVRDFHPRCFSSIFLHDNSWVDKYEAELEDARSQMLHPLRPIPCSFWPARLQGHRLPFSSEIFDMYALSPPLLYHCSSQIGEWHEANQLGAPLPPLSGNSLWLSGLHRVHSHAGRSATKKQITMPPHTSSAIPRAFLWLGVCKNGYTGGPLTSFKGDSPRPWRIACNEVGIHFPICVHRYDLRLESLRLADLNIRSIFGPRLFKLFIYIYILTD